LSQAFWTKTGFMPRYRAIASMTSTSYPTSCFMSEGFQYM
jgi:hypothetical protein